MGKNKKQISRTQGFEVLRDLGGVIKDSVGNTSKEAWTDTWEQILGVDLSSKTPEKNNQQEPLTVTDPVTGAKEVFNASKLQSSKDNTVQKKYAEKSPRLEKAGAIDYSGEFVKSSERAMRVEMHEINNRLRDIMSELQRLINSSKALKMEFSDVGMQQMPSQAGEYHINFFEWLLLTIRAARQKVEDSGAWLTAVKSKKNKRGYWNMFKKHGTTFGLSNERVVATQAG